MLVLCAKGQVGSTIDPGHPGRLSVLKDGAAVFRQPREPRLVLARVLAKAVPNPMLSLVSKRVWLLVSAEESCTGARMYFPRVCVFSMLPRPFLRDRFLGVPRLPAGLQAPKLSRGEGRAQHSIMKH